jgi:hypothetical protein
VRFIEPRKTPMTQQAQPRWPALGGCPWLTPAPPCSAQTQYPAHSPALPQAPTEPRPAAWVNAARSKPSQSAKPAPLADGGVITAAAALPASAGSYALTRTTWGLTCGASRSPSQQPRGRTAPTLDQPGRVAGQQIRLTSPADLPPNLPVSLHLALAAPRSDCSVSPRADDLPRAKPPPARWYPRWDS